MVVTALVPILASIAASPATPWSASRDLTDATPLYNAGTIALDRRDWGPAVAFLVAAERIEPRSSDIRANLIQAVTAAARASGNEATATDAEAGAIPVAVDEAWWSAAVLILVGSLLGVAGTVRPIPRPVRWVRLVLFVAALGLSGMLLRSAWEESVHPEAVVIVPALSVDRGSDEASRPTVLLAAGDRVRVGGVRGSLVEIRVGGNPIGWAAREGLWCVVDVPRYTPGFLKR